MNNSLSHKSYRNQNRARIAMIILSILIIVLRIRKMVHLNMMGEETAGVDWFMLVLWLAVAIVNAVQLMRGIRKRLDYPSELNT